MRNRFTGVMVAMAVAAAVSLTVMPLAGQAGRGTPPAGGAAGQGRGAAPAQPAGRGAATPRPARIAGKPNLNGIYQAINTAYWNLEDHSASDLKQFWQLGAIAAIPPGQSVVEGGTIPYLPAALKKRAENQAGWPKTDPEAKCYMGGIPRSTYMPYPFQIVQGQKDILFVYEYASSNRIVHMDKPSEAPVDSWMGWSNGKWEGDTLVIDVSGHNDQTWFDRAGNHHSDQLKVTERYQLLDTGNLQYSATIEDSKTFSKPWTIRMPLYRLVEQNVQLLEFKCVEFSEELLYGDLKKKTE
ncbi:MAG TPA: hypothetical protein VFB85_07775 [Vicinamibacterales bacterium]|jgi:hypothetical protein|nr:hypothetical protein [Vicinamibacterales bacterium]